MSDLNWWPIEHLNSSSANANLGSRLFDNASAHPLQPGALPLAKYDPRVAPQVFSPATLTFQSSAAFRSQTSGNSSRPIMRGAVAPGASAVPAAGIITSDLGFGSQRSLPIRHSVMTGSQNPQSASHTSQLYNEQQQLGLNYYDQLDPNVNNLPYVRGDHILQDGGRGIDRFICHWPGCTQQGGYKQKGCLARHIRSKHQYPGSHICLVCFRPFDRADNLRDHCRRKHPEAG